MACGHFDDGLDEAGWRRARILVRLTLGLLLAALLILIIVVIVLGPTGIGPASKGL